MIDDPAVGFPGVTQKTMQHDDERPRPPDKPDEAPDTPTDEPKPAPVQDPPSEVRCRGSPQPKSAHHVEHALHQRPDHAHRKVEPRLREGTVIRVEVVIHHVDAAAIGDGAIDDTQLAMQAAPTARPQHAQAPQRRVDAPLDAALRETLPPPFARTSTINASFLSCG